MDLLPQISSFPRPRSPRLNTQPSAVSWVPNRGEISLLWVCWLHFCWHSTECIWSPLPQGDTADSSSAIGHQTSAVWPLPTSLSTSRIKKMPVPRGTAVSLVMSSEDNPVMSSLTIPLKTRVKETLAIGNWPAFFTADLAVLIHGMRLWQKSCLWAHEELFSELPPARICFQLSRPKSRTPVEQKLQARYPSRLFFLSSAHTSPWLLSHWTVSLQNLQ